MRPPLQRGETVFQILIDAASTDLYSLVADKPEFDPNVPLMVRHRGPISCTRKRNPAHGIARLKQLNHSIDVKNVSVDKQHEI